MTFSRHIEPTWWNSPHDYTLQSVILWNVQLLTFVYTAVQSSRPEPDYIILLYLLLLVYEYVILSFCVQPSTCTVCGYRFRCRIWLKYISESQFARIDALSPSKTCYVIIKLYLFSLHRLVCDNSIKLYISVTSPKNLGAGLSPFLHFLKKQQIGASLHIYSIIFIFYIIKHK